MITRRRCLLAIVPAGVLFIARPASAADSSTFSEAERLLFVEDHFKTLTKATQLDYEYRRRGSLEEEFTDPVRMMVAAKGATGGRSVKVDFLSGDRRMELPDVKDAEGNPLILYFLEREVREMHRLTGGSVSYYRKRIRMALAEGAQVKPVTLTVAGKPVQAREIHIAPYRDDPARPRYEKFAEKTFVLTLSDQVPGGIVELRSELLPPEGGGGPKPLLAESVKYVARR
jgi:hypothetical protein